MNLELIENLKQIQNGLVKLSMDRKVVLPHHKTFELVDELRALVKNIQEEVEANAWARDFLIPTKLTAAMASLPKTKAAVTEFARSIGVHPAIVVGRMQHDQLLDVTWLNDLKVSFVFKAKA